MRSLAVVLLSLVLCASAQAAERTFFEGYIGTTPAAASDLAKTYFDHKETRALDRRILEHWLVQSYGPMRDSLAGLTARRQGVASGMIEDPRAADTPWPGSIPAVWRTAIYAHVFR